MKPAFQDFDRASKGVYQTRTTSKTRFERVLALNSIHLTEEEYAIIERKYECEVDSGSVNYVLFCSHLEEEPAVGPTVASSSLNESPLQKFVRTGKKECAPDLQSVLDDIRAQVLTQRIRINEFLRDYDKLRSGVISKQQFSSGVFLAKIELDAKELDIIAEHYAAPSRPGYLRWVHFCDDIDAVVTTKRLETKPSATSSTQADVTARLHTERVPRYTPDVQSILTKLREVVRTRGVLMPPFFKDFDTHNVGQITPNRLGQALTRHDLGLAQSEIKALSEAYMDPRTRDVCYRKLV